MASLYCIFARESDKAVIFRRGPSEQVLLIAWDLQKHTFEIGQWFKGRIYARKSDLSPNGEKLVYYGATHHGELSSWFAVSNPPYLTALALWEACGSWNDLSVFESNTMLVLGGYNTCPQPYAGFNIPSQLHVRHKPWPGYFNILPEHDRMLRDGWQLFSGEPAYQEKSSESGKPLIYRKMAEGIRQTYLELEVHTVHKPSYSLCTHAGTRMDLDAPWADIRGSDVFYSQGGKLLSIKIKDDGCSIEYGQPIMIADFTDLKFEAREAPEYAQRW